MNTCVNCGHEVKKNYYGGWLHKAQWMDYCSVLKGKIPTIYEKPDICGCTIPIGKI